jgi:hypothetical protein
MNYYIDVGVAYAKLLLITCLRNKNPPGNQNFFLSMLLLSDSLLPLYLKTNSKFVMRRGSRGAEAIEHVLGPPELSQDPSLHHPFDGFLKSICSPK